MVRDDVGEIVGQHHLVDASIHFQPAVREPPDRLTCLPVQYVEADALILSGHEEAVDRFGESLLSINRHVEERTTRNYFWLAARLPVQVVENIELLRLLQLVPTGLKLSLIRVCRG